MNQPWFTAPALANGFWRPPFLSKSRRMAENEQAGQFTEGAGPPILCRITNLARKRILCAPLSWRYTRRANIGR